MMWRDAPASLELMETTSLLLKKEEMTLQVRREH
jgi:hypothetical protein